MWQRTISKPIKLSGYGLFSNQLITLKCFPAEAETGIFINDIALTPDYVQTEKHTTCLRNHEKAISQIEHFLFALFALGIDNLFVEIDGNEFPFFDGSVRDFINALARAGLKELPPHKKRVLLVKKKLFVYNRQGFLIFLPKNNFSCLTVAFFPNRFNIHYLSIKDSFFNLYLEKISQAQSFGRAHFFNHKNIYDPHYRKTARWIIPKRLKPTFISFGEEFVWHKLLDLLGDLKILNRELKGRIIAFSPSHSLNLKLVKELKRYAYD